MKREDVVTAINQMRLAAPKLLAHGDRKLSAQLLDSATILEQQIRTTAPTMQREDKILAKADTFITSELRFAPGQKIRLQDLWTCFEAWSSTYNKAIMVGKKILNARVLEDRPGVRKYKSNGHWWLVGVGLNRVDASK